MSGIEPPFARSADRVRAEQLDTAGLASTAAPGDGVVLVDDELELADTDRSRSRPCPAPGATSMVVPAPPEPGLEITGAEGTSTAVIVPPKFTVPRSVSAYTKNWCDSPTDVRGGTE